MAEQDARDYIRDIMNKQNNNDTPRFISQEERDKQKVERIKQMYGLTHGKRGKKK